MRIIGGTYGGRRLKSIERTGLRPTTDRVRESIFNILASRVDIEGSRVLDLFAGTGALGIEALSRGAASCVFVESDRKTAGVIEENLTTLGARERGRVIVRDALKFLAETDARYDLVFADPPYAAPIFGRLVHDLFRLDRLAEGGLFLLEHAGGMKIAHDDDIELVAERGFGDTGISLYRRAAKAQEGV